MQSPLVELKLKCRTCSRLNGFSIPKDSLTTCLLRCGGCHGYLSLDRDVVRSDDDDSDDEPDTRRPAKKPRIPPPPVSNFTPSPPTFDVHAHDHCKLECDRLHSKIKTLSKELTSTKRKHSHATEKLAAVRKENSKLKAENSKLKTENSKLKSENTKQKHKIEKKTKQLSDKNIELELARRSYGRIETRFAQFRPPPPPVSKPPKYVGNCHYRFKVWEQKQKLNSQRKKKGGSSASSKSVVIDLEAEGSPFGTGGGYGEDDLEEGEVKEYSKKKPKVKSSAAGKVDWEKLLNLDGSDEEDRTSKNRDTCSEQRAMCFGFIETATRSQLDVLLTIDDLRSMALKIGHVLPDQHFAAFYHQVKDLIRSEYDGSDKGVKDYGLCTNCHLPFWSKIDANVHARRCANVGSRFRFCPFCDDQAMHTAYASTLCEHVRSHTGYHPWKCKEPGCNDNFPQASRWRSHADSHRPLYSCGFCPRSFRNQKHLKSHMTKMHPTEPPAPVPPPPPPPPPPRTARGRTRPTSLPTNHATQTIRKRPPMAFNQSMAANQARLNGLQNYGSPSGIRPTHSPYQQLLSPQSLYNVDTLSQHTMAFSGLPMTSLNQSGVPQSQFPLLANSMLLKNSLQSPPFGSHPGLSPAGSAAQVNLTPATEPLSTTGARPSSQNFMPQQTANLVMSNTSPMLPQGQNSIPASRVLNTTTTTFTSGVSSTSEAESLGSTSKGIHSSVNHQLGGSQTRRKSDFGDTQLTFLDGI